MKVWPFAAALAEGGGKPPQEVVDRIGLWRDRANVSKLYLQILDLSRPMNSLYHRDIKSFSITTTL
jgi:hypothetical protein